MLKSTKTEEKKSNRTSPSRKNLKSNIANPTQQVNSIYSICATRVPLKKRKQAHNSNLSLFHLRKNRLHTCLHSNLCRLRLNSIQHTSLEVISAP